MGLMRSAFLVTAAMASTLSYGADVSISDEVIYSGSGVSQNATGYLTLKNNQSKTIYLRTVDSDVAAKAVMEGVPKEGIALKPGLKVHLAKKNSAIGLEGLKKDLVEGEKVNLTLHFSDGDAIDVALPVKPYPANIHSVSVRATMPSMSSSAAYMTIHNKGEKNLQLDKVASTIAAKTEIHTTVMKDGVMSMEEIKNLEIPAGKMLELKPGGYHVMLMGLERQIKAGEHIPITLTFKDGESMTIQAMAMDEIKGQGMAH